MHRQETRDVDVLSWNDDGSIWVEFEDGIGIDNLEPKYLLQSTGLTDKNGVEIFEGDIVQIEDFCAYVIEYEIITEDYVVKSGFSNFGDLTKTKIIGNIHENPELLERS